MDDDSTLWIGKKHLLWFWRKKEPYLQLAMKLPSLSAECRGIRSGTMVITVALFQVWDSVVDKVSTETELGSLALFFSLFHTEYNASTIQHCTVVNSKCSRRCCSLSQLNSMLYGGKESVYLAHHCNPNIL